MHAEPSPRPRGASYARSTAVPLTKTAQQVENALWLYAFLIPIANVVSWAVFLYRAARGTSI